MTDGMIVCPECLTRLQNGIGGECWGPCSTCGMTDNNGTIPDRRKPSETEDALRAEIVRPQEATMTYAMEAGDLRAEIARLQIENEDSVSVAVHNAVMDRLQLDFDKLRAENENLKDKMACQETECQLLRELVASGAEEIASLKLEIYSWHAGAECDRHEIATLKAENQKMHHDWMSEHAELELLRAERIENRKEEA